MSDTLPQKQWLLTQEALDRFLASLDPDRDRAGEIYQIIQRKLTGFFACRDCPHPEEHADETINRVARKLADGEQFRDVTTYVYGVARMLLLEIARDQARANSTRDHLMLAQPVSADPDESDSRLACLSQCLQNLPLDSRELITQYYQGEKSAKIEQRRKLSARLSIPLSHLRIRAYRLREALATCLGRCLKGEKNSAGVMDRKFPPVAHGGRPPCDE